MVNRNTLALIIGLTVSSVVVGDLLINPFGTFGAGGGDLDDIKTDMVSWYDFDDNSDAHSNNDLENTGPPTYASGYVTIVGGSETLFDSNVAGALGYDFLPSAGTDDGTIAMWISPNSSTAHLEASFSGKNNSVKVIHTTVADGWRGTIHSGFASSSSGAPVDDQWYFVVVTWDDSTDTRTVIVDDSSTGSYSASGSNFDNSIGWYGDGRVAWAGFWNRILTADEITALYDLTETGDYDDLP